MTTKYYDLTLTDGERDMLLESFRNGTLDPDEDNSDAIRLYRMYNNWQTTSPYKTGHAARGRPKLGLDEAVRARVKRIERKRPRTGPRRIVIRRK